MIVPRLFFLVPLISALSAVHAENVVVSELPDWCMSRVGISFGLCPSAADHNLGIAKTFIEELKKPAVDDSQRRKYAESYIKKVFASVYGRDVQDAIAMAIVLGLWKNATATTPDKWPFEMFDDGSFLPNISTAILFATATSVTWRPILVEYAAKMGVEINKNASTDTTNTLKEFDFLKASSINFVNFTADISDTYRLVVSCPLLSNRTPETHLMLAFRNRHLHNVEKSVRCVSWADPNNSNMFSVMTTIGIMIAIFTVFDF